jgi:hypothetical protein
MNRASLRACEKITAAFIFSQAPIAFYLATVWVGLAGLVSSRAFSATITTVLPAGASGMGNAKTFEESGVTLSVFEKLALPTPIGTLPFVGWGLRKKNFALFSVNVYMVAHYASSASGLPKTLHIIFLRDVTKEKVVAAYEEALQSNGLDPSSKDLKAILERMNSDRKKGESVILCGASREGAKEMVMVSDSSASSVFEGNMLATRFFKIWFGETPELQALKQKLLGGKRLDQR